MAHILVHHKVEDFKKWKTKFEEHSAYRSQNGSNGGRIYQSSHNPNEVFVILEWDSLEKAQMFAQSPDIKKVMMEAGVVGMPAIYFVEEAATTPK
jgi:heme-degrading monooxygenase HmoA